MFPLEYLAVLDPFSDEAKNFVETSPPVDAMPPEIIERAINRVKWSTREMTVPPDSKAIRDDVLSFYLMCQGAASVSYPYSREVRLISDMTRDTIRYRMYDLFKRGGEDFCVRVVQRSIKLVKLGGSELDIRIPNEDIRKLRDQEMEKDEIDIADDRVLPQYMPRYAVRWVDLSPLLRHRRTELTRLYLVKGWAVLTLRDLWDFYANLISVKTEDYIQSVYERMLDSGPPPKSLVEVGNRISELLPKRPELADKFVRVSSRRLRPEFFPPCISKALGGVGAGLRNYAITMLLTSFLTYAKIAPPSTATRIGDVISDISTVRDEIAPLIFEAAERCNPPLFRDQPQEKASIFYHMGFGMTTDPKIGDSGKSKWYRPPNCAKIQMSAPQLCNPDEFCRKIKNPLTYYFRKISEQAKTGRGEKA